MKYRSGAVRSKSKTEVTIWDVALDVQNILEANNVVKRLADGTIAKRHFASLAQQLTIDVKVHDQTIAIDAKPSAIEKLVWLQAFLDEPPEGVRARKTYCGINITVTKRVTKAS